MPSNKKVAYLINLYPAVSHTFIRREIAELEKLGVEIDRYSIRNSGAGLVDAADRAELAKTRVVLDAGIPRLLLAATWMKCTRPLRWLRAVSAMLRMGWTGNRGLARHIAYLFEAALLTRWLERSKVTHLHAHFGTNSAAVAFLTHILSGIPYSFTVHGPEEFDRPESLALRAKIENAAFVVGVSSFGRSQLYRWCPHPQWPNIQVVRCGVDDSFLRLPPTPVPDAPKLLCVGRLCEQKAQLLLVEAVRRLAAEGVAVELTLIGDGELRAEIESLVDKHGLRKHILMLGSCSGETVRNAIRASRAMVLPSLAEGLPLALVEALALGRPVISTYIAGIPELVTAECGWLVPAGSADALTFAMRSALAATTETIEAMGRCGAERAGRMHSAANEARTLLNLFERNEA